VNLRGARLRDQSKQQLGMDQYQGRLYPGLQHHLSAVLCAYSYVVAERERLAGEGNRRAAPMQRTAQIQQRHAPHSIATLRKRLALAMSPLLLTWLPELTPKRGLRQGPARTTTLPDGTYIRTVAILTVLSDDLANRSAYSGYASGADIVAANFQAVTCGRR
jgi:hypothetical protein